MVDGLFRYNWQAREAWFAWCEAVPAEALVAPRTGGLGSILRTLFHIVDVEYSWIQEIRGEVGFDEPFERHASLAAVRLLSAAFRPYVAEYLEGADAAERRRTFPAPWNPATRLEVGRVLEHTVAHEIHHVGQLSVWARQMGREPVTANWV